MGRYSKKAGYGTRVEEAGNQESPWWCKRRHHRNNNRKHGTRLSLESYEVTRMRHPIVMLAAIALFAVSTYRFEQPHASADMVGPAQIPPGPSAQPPRPRAGTCSRAQSEPDANPRSLPTQSPKPES